MEAKRFEKPYLKVNWQNIIAYFYLYGIRRMFLFQPSPFPDQINGRIDGQFQDLGGDDPADHGDSFFFQKSLSSLRRIR